MAELSPVQIEQQQVLADRLQSAADEAAGQVRNLYIVFLSFGLYLAITVGGTTDEQLLRGSPVRLPIIDVGLPLFAFYWLAPALFVLFHFNLLLQLTLLSEKLRRLDEVLHGLPDEPVRRATLSQFVFSQMLIGGHGAGDGRSTIKVLLNLMGWTTFVLLPLAVLLLTQIQFLPYHDPATTWLQRALIAVDLLLLWLLWLPAIAPESLRRVRVVMRRRARQARRILASPLRWPTGLVIGLLGLVRAVPTLPARIRRRLRDDLGRDWRLLRLQEVSAISLMAALLVATIPGEFLAGPTDSVIGESGNVGFNRNLSLPEAKLVLQLPEPSLIEKIGDAKALEKYTTGLDLRRRDLRFANLWRADMRKADLRGADLHGANLSEADLQGVNLSLADLQGASLSLANLRGADLGGANLQGAILVGANLRGANLGGANLQGADLGCFLVACADLRGANLFEAALRGANLGGANLQGADLGGANLQGAYLGWADLRGAYLGCFFGECADLQGAYLGGAHLWRARVDDEPDARWRLADLRGADAEQVDLGALIAELQDQIPDEEVRAKVVARLKFGLRDDERGDLPSWQGQPQVMFWSDDPIPDALGWRARKTDPDYDENLAVFLGDLVCGEDGDLAVAESFTAYDESRLFSQLLAQRLTPEDPKDCPAAAELPADLRGRLRSLAARLDQPAPE